MENLLTSHNCPHRFEIMTLFEMIGEANG